MTAPRLPFPSRYQAVGYGPDDWAVLDRNEPHLRLDERLYGPARAVLLFTVPRSAGPDEPARRLFAYMKAHSGLLYDVPRWLTEAERDALDRLRAVVVGSEA